MRGDATQIRQVVMNLITNAAESLDDAGGIIRVSMGATEGEPEMAPGIYVFLEVADSGSGMDSATQAKMFEPFFTTKFAGRGLGLAAVQGIVRSHGGAIRIRSAPGEGTTFRVILPADTSGELPKDDGPPPRLSAGRPRGKGAILVADDEEMVRSTSKRLIERAGFTVLLARDGREALNVYDANADDVVAVLLDLTMPVLGGDVALDELLRRDPAPRVILTSGFSEAETSERFAGKPLSAFLQKPYRADELLSAIARCVGDR